MNGVTKGLNCKLFQRKCKEKIVTISSNKQYMKSEHLCAGPGSQGSEYCALVQGRW